MKNAHNSLYSFEDKLPPPGRRRYFSIVSRIEPVLTFVKHLALPWALAAILVGLILVGYGAWLFFTGAVDFSAINIVSLIPNFKQIFGYTGAVIALLYWGSQARR